MVLAMMIHHWEGSRVLIPDLGMSVAMDTRLQFHNRSSRLGLNRLSRGLPIKGQLNRFNSLTFIRCRQPLLGKIVSQRKPVEDSYWQGYTEEIDDRALPTKSSE